MPAPPVVLDTDFLSSFLKIDRPELIREFFQVESLWIPRAVAQELAATSLMTALNTLGWVEVHEVTNEQVTGLLVSSEFLNLGTGEQEAITLASFNSEAVLLMSDKRASRCAESLGVQVVNIPAFLLAYRQSGEGNVEDLRALIDALQKQDHYGFSNEVLKKLF